MSVPAFITGRRIEKAQNLLLTSTDLSIDRIASAAGFQDVIFFTVI